MGHRTAGFAGHRPTAHPAWRLTIALLARSSPEHTSGLTTRGSHAPAIPGERYATKGLASSTAGRAMPLATQRSRGSTPTSGAYTLRIDGATVNAGRPVADPGASNGRATTLWCPRARRAVWATAPRDATTLSRAGTLGRAPADRRYGSPQCGDQLVNRDHEHVPINAVHTASSYEAQNRNRPSATPPSPPADNPGRLHPYVDQMPLLISPGLRLDHHGQAGGRNRDRVDITRPQPPQRMPQPPASVSRTASAR